MEANISNVNSINIFLFSSSDAAWLHEAIWGFILSLIMSKHSWEPLDRKSMSVTRCHSVKKLISGLFWLHVFLLFPWTLQHYFDFEPTDFSRTEQRSDCIDVTDNMTCALCRLPAFFTLQSVRSNWPFKKLLFKYIPVSTALWKALLKIVQTVHVSCVRELYIRFEVRSGVVLIKGGINNVRKKTTNLPRQ